jgi:hypothetical protein
MAAAGKVDRDPGEIRLVAVSKTVDLERIRQAIAAGVTILGENYLQESQTKISSLEAKISWHFIGHLQSKKAAAAAARFDLIHSVDRWKLAQALNQAAQKIHKIQEVLIEVNLGQEVSKSGLSPEDVPSLLKSMVALPFLRVVGLMAMPPWFPDPEEVRPYFRQLRELRDSLVHVAAPNVHLQELSMGMSGDFEVAIEEGATLVRVGTAIFGTRQVKGS